MEKYSLSEKIDIVSNLIFGVLGMFLFSSVIFLVICIGLFLLTL